MIKSGIFVGALFFSMPVNYWPINLIIVNDMRTIKIKALLIKSRSDEWFSESLPKQSVYCSVQFTFKPNE